MFNEGHVPGEDRAGTGSAWRTGREEAGEVDLGAQPTD